VTSDRFRVYTGLPLSRRQLCWAHLARDFQALAESSGPAAARIGRAAQEQIGHLFGHWHAFRTGTRTRAELQAEMQPVQNQFATLLEPGSALSGKAGALCRGLQGQWEALWNFLIHEGVEPTNNHAERMLRPAVLWRKTSFGHQSAGGQQYVERMLTVVSTLRLQGRNVLTYLEQALEATRTAQPAPTLLPSA
jgi:transposase